MRPGADAFLDPQGRCEVAGREPGEGLDSAYVCVPLPHALHHAGVSLAGARPTVVRMARGRAHGRAIVQVNAERTACTLGRDRAAAASRWCRAADAPDARPCDQ